MSYQRDREEFIHHMGQEGLNFRDTQAILEMSKLLQKLAIKDCNMGLSRVEEMEENRLRTEIQAIIREQNAKNPSQTWEVETGGDPRGSVVKIRTPSKRGNCFGDSSLTYVPTPEY